SLILPTGISHRNPVPPIAPTPQSSAIDIPDLEGHPESPGQDGIVLEPVIDSAVRIRPALRAPPQTPRRVEETGAERLRIVCEDHALEDGTMGILRGAQRVTLARLHPRRRVSRDELEIPVGHEESEGSRKHLRTRPARDRGRAQRIDELLTLDRDHDESGAEDREEAAFHRRAHRCTYVTRMSSLCGTGPIHGAARSREAPCSMIAPCERSAAHMARSN